MTPPPPHPADDGVVRPSDDELNRQPRRRPAPFRRRRVAAVFVNYRTGDEESSATLIERELSRRFGSDLVFRAAKSISPGEAWEEAILTAVRRSGALVAVVGPRWLTAVDGQGRRALDNADDWTRREIVEAFASGVRVVPVLIGQTPRLTKADLPAAVAQLAGCQYQRLDHRDVDAGITRLVDVLVKWVPELGVAQRRRARRRVLLAAASGVAVASGGVIAALVLLPGSSPERVRAPVGSYTAQAPWRLLVEDHIARNNNGCTVTLTQMHSGTRISVPDDLYGTKKLQIHQAGSFRWQTNDPGCRITPLPGSGTAKLPFFLDRAGDSDAFLAPHQVAVQVKDYRGNPWCSLELVDPADGQVLDSATVRPGSDTVLLDTGGRPTAYLGYSPCGVRVSAQR